MVKTVASLAPNNVVRRRGFVSKRPVGGVVQKRNLNQTAPSKNSAYNRKWLEENDKDKKPFSDEILATTFSKENVEKLVAAAKAATETEVNESNRLLSDDYIYSLQITSHRVPHVPVHLSRITLPHTLETAESDICIFVKDLKRGRKLDYEPTVKHYEALLKSKKVDRSITIIPINQLYNEFSTFELRRKLTYLYDRFLVDKAVATHVNGFLGHKLLTKGRSAIPVDLAADNLAEEIEATLRKVFYKHVNSGITQSVQIGRHSMTDEQIGENIIDMVNQLAVIHPGGTQNVYKLHLKPNVNISVAVPLYVDLAKPQLDTPTAVGTVEKTIGAAAENASAILENFDISTTGEVVDKNPAEEAAEDVEMDDSAVAAATSTPAPKPKAKPVVKKAKPAASSEDAINDLILKNLKKIVPQLAVGNQNQNTGRVAKNNNQQAPVQQVQQKRQQNRQNNNQGNINQQQHQVVPQQQQQMRQNNMNQGGGNQGFVQRNNMGNNQVRRQNNQGNQPMIRHNNYNNQGNNQGNQGYNNRQMAPIGGGGNNRNFNANTGYGGGNMGGGNNNWGNQGGNNDPWGNRNQF